MKKKPTVINSFEQLNEVLPQIDKFTTALTIHEIREQIKITGNVTEIEYRKFDTFLEMNNYLLKENEHQKNRNIVRDQKNIIANIPDGQRIVDQAKEYCKTVINIPEHLLDISHHEHTP